MSKAALFLLLLIQFSANTGVASETEPLVEKTIEQSDLQQKQLSKKISLGLNFPFPAGISSRYILTPTTSIHAAVGVAVYGPITPHMQVDYIWHKPGVFPPDFGSIDMYYGYGAKLFRNVFDDQTQFGPREIFGFSYETKDHKIEFFAGLAFNLIIVPQNAIWVEMAGGFRFFL